jgi:hypothetical protein
MVEINRLKYFNLSEKYIFLICLDCATKYSCFMTSKYDLQIKNLIDELKEEIDRNEK